MKKILEVLSEDVLLAEPSSDDYHDVKVGQNQLLQLFPQSPHCLLTHPGAAHITLDIQQQHLVSDWPEAQHEEKTKQSHMKHAIY